MDAPDADAALWRDDTGEAAGADEPGKIRSMDD